MNPHSITTWHYLVQTGDPSGLDSLLANDAVFVSSIMRTPHPGKVLAKACLSAAVKVFSTLDSAMCARSSGQPKA